MIQEPMVVSSVTLDQKETQYKTFEPQLTPQEAVDITQGNEAWSEMYQKNINPEAVYVMSPEVCKRVSILATRYLQQMQALGFNNLEAWVAGAPEDIYMEKLLNRVNIPDTGEPIENNVKHCVNHLKQVQELESSKPGSERKVPTVRSYFTGAAIAEKYLLTNAYKQGVKGINLITTDISAHSVAYAAANLEVWNAQLPPEDRYNIVVVQGDIPAELYGKPSTIVLQIEDAKRASERDLCRNCGWDALLIDNGLPYVEKEFVDPLLANAIRERSQYGLMLAVLGLNEKIKVEIPTAKKLQTILFRGDISSWTEKILNSKGKNTPNNYRHFYDFTRDVQGNVLIKEVVSSGSARTYNWIKKLLLKRDIQTAARVLGTVKKATSLSSASGNVITPPSSTHEKNS